MATDVRDFELSGVLNLPIAYKNQEELRPQVSPNHLLVNEIFYSIQGEGRLAGTPMVFVRTNLCRVNCNFCDTKYTWQFISHNKNYTPQELLVHIKENFPTAKWICFTGGEPFEQIDGLYNACKHLKENGLKIAIETSGSIIIPNNFKDVTDNIVCSPKKYNGANFSSPISEIKILVKFTQNPETVRNFVRGFREKKVFVFIQPIEPNPVIYGNYDGLDDVQKTALLLYRETKRKENEEVWKKNIAKAIEICKLYGYRVSIQVHKYLGVR